MQEGPGPKQITSSTHIIIFNSRCDMLGTLTPPPPPAPSKCTGMGMVCLRNFLHAPLCRWCLGALPAPVCRWSEDCRPPSAGGVLVLCRPPSAGGALVLCRPLSAGGLRTAGRLAAIVCRIACTDRNARTLRTLLVPK